jgi:hypothetical protein
MAVGRLAVVPDSNWHTGPCTASAPTALKAVHAASASHAVLQRRAVCPEVMWAAVSDVLPLTASLFGLADLVRSTVLMMLPKGM